MNEPWYVKSFQDDYLTIYAHRTDEAAREEIAQVLPLLALTPPAKVLDLCCGNGRHSRALRDLGFQVTGIDLSETLLNYAQEHNPENKITYLRCDVRETPFVEEFASVFNLFTSFGYFDDPEENLKVFQSIYRALKHGGQFVIDFLNPEYVKNNLVPYSERQVAQLHIEEWRTLEDQQVLKKIKVYDGGEIREYEERVHLFSLAEMEAMLSQAGLHVNNVYGDFTPNAYQPNFSPRMIIVGNK